MDANNSPQALNLSEMVDYQEGSVVSRTLIERNSGTVTLFAFDAGESLSEHTAPFDAMVYLLDGEAEVTLSHQPLSLKAGEMLIMPAGKPHALKATRHFKMLLIMIKQ